MEIRQGDRSIHIINLTGDIVRLFEPFTPAHIRVGDIDKYLSYIFEPEGRLPVPVTESPVYGLPIPLIKRKYKLPTLPPRRKNTFYIVPSPILWIARRPDFIAPLYIHPYIVRDHNNRRLGTKMLYSIWH